jgi:hypothetical protein
MALVSAFEDLQQVTLRAIHGCLQRLEYLSRLRDREGSYTHWGLARVYGEMAAKKALTEAHRAELSKVLSTPLGELAKQAEKYSAVTGLPAAAYVDQLSNNDANLLPPDPGAASARHLSSVLHALSGLLKTRKLVAKRRA